MELTLCWRFGRDGRVDDNEVWNIIFVIDNWYLFRNIDILYILYLFWKGKVDDSEVKKIDSESKTVNSKNLIIFLITDVWLSWYYY